MKTVIELLIMRLSASGSFFEVILIFPCACVFAFVQEFSWTSQQKTIRGSSCVMEANALSEALGLASMGACFLLCGYCLVVVVV